jgi:hypothetical protein
MTLTQTAAEVAGLQTVVYESVIKGIMKLRNKRKEEKFRPFCSFRLLRNLFCFT